MAYRFEPTEILGEGFRRTAEEQLDVAIGELSEGAEQDPVKAIHSARKALKMERSLLRLGRSALRGPTRGATNTRLRDAARRLSGTRDADVMLEALDGLAERYAGQVPEATFSAIRKRLESERENTRGELAGSGETEVVIDELRAVRLEAGGWQLRQTGWKAIEPGLRREYIRGLKARKRALREPTVENLHAWRKRVKDLWYHLRLLEGAAPVILEGQVNEAHELSNRLGDDHDLAVLAEKITGLAGDLKVDLGPVMALVAHRRDQLQQEARFIGERLYAESPKAYTRRLRSYWNAGRAEVRAVETRDATKPAETTAHAEVV